MDARQIIYDACDSMVEQVLKDEHYLDKWTDEDIYEAVCYTRMLVAETLVVMSVRADKLTDKDGKFDAITEEELENYAMDGIDLVRSFGRGY